MGWTPPAEMDVAVLKDRFKKVRGMNGEDWCQFMMRLDGDSIAPRLKYVIARQDGMLAPASVHSKTRCWSRWVEETTLHSALESPVSVVMSTSSNKFLLQAEWQP